MIKKYVCESCYGHGTVVEFADFGNGDVRDVEGPCPECALRGAPPWVEMAVNGPPSPREGVIDVEYTIIEFTKLPEDK